MPLVIGYVVIFNTQLVLSSTHEQESLIERCRTGSIPFYKRISQLFFMNHILIQIRQFEKTLLFISISKETVLDLNEESVL